MTNNTTVEEDLASHPIVFAFGYNCMAFLSIITGVVGLLANGLVLFMLVVGEKQKSGSSNFLIIFQFVVNVFSCALLIVSYTLKLMLDVKGDTMKRWGLGVCILFVGDGLAYMAAYTAATNLGVIAFERYMKIVHAVRHRTYFRRWMYCPTIMFAIASSILMNSPVFWATNIDEHGGCMSYQYWQSAVGFQTYAISLTLWNFLGLLIELVYCYGCIIAKLRKRPTVTPGSDATQQKDDPNRDGLISKAQINIIKTMILISLTYAATTVFIHFGYMGASFGDATLTGNATQYYVYVSLYFVNAWLDPFIYAVSNREVRHRVLRYLSPNKIQAASYTTNNESG